MRQPVQISSACRRRIRGCDDPERPSDPTCHGPAGLFCGAPSFSDIQSVPHPPLHRLHDLASAWIMLAGFRYIDWLRPSSRSLFNRALASAPVCSCAPDPFAQYEKLAAAYTVAAWSEEYFNNRALFSDHYLSERLREFPQWNDDAKPAWGRLANSTPAPLHDSEARTGQQSKARAAS